MCQAASPLIQRHTSYTTSKVRAASTAAAAATNIAVAEAFAASDLSVDDKGVPDPLEPKTQAQTGPLNITS